MTRGIPAIVIAKGLNGLCTVRSLGRANVPVWAVVDRLTENAASSRFSQVFLRLPEETLPQCLERLCRVHGISAAVCIATTDASARELAWGVNALPPGVVFPGPPSAIVDLLQDKRSELEALASITDCLPVSVSRLPQQWEDLVKALGPHIILKPRTQLLADQLGMKNCIVHDASALSHFYTSHGNELDWFVAQEVIPGSDADIWQCNAVFNSHHELVSAFTFQKLGMSPPHYGVTTMGKSARNSEVIDLVKSIGAALQYTGPAGFEFKRDARNGQYRYIEINPRFGMSNIFDTTCGVNTAYRTYLLGCGDHATSPLEQRDGLVFVDAFSDLYSRIIDDREPWSSILGRYFGLRGTHRVAAYWDRDDIRPLLRMIVPRLRLLQRSAGRLLRRSLPF